MGPFCFKRSTNIGHAPILCKTRKVNVESSCDELQVAPSVIESVATEEFFVGTMFNDASLLEDVDAVARTNGAKTMRNDDGGALPHKPLESFLNEVFSFGIQRG
jgi:hypothetical protein